jgi:hypothetical protein
MTLADVTSFLNAWKWLILIAVGVLLLAGIWKPSCPKTDAPTTPSNGVNVTPPIPDTDHSIPPPEGAYRDRQTYTQRDTVHADDSVGTIFTTSITVYNPKEPGKPPLVVNSNPSSPVEVVYTEIREPYFDITPKWHFGVSSGYPFQVSPWLGVSVLTLFSTVDLGAGVDFNGCGVTGDFRLYQNIHLGASYSLFKFSEGADVRVTLSLQLF